VIEPFKNFEAANKKRNIQAFGLIPVDQSIAWIADNPMGQSFVTNGYSSNAVFDIATGNIQYMLLTGDVNTSSFVFNGGLFIPEPTVFTLQIAQDGSGFHVFNWPTTIRNYQQALQVSMEPNTLTTMYFEYRNGGWDLQTPPVVGPRI
jgi:hypothetical protein